MQMIEWHVVSHGAFSEYVKSCPKKETTQEEAGNENEYVKMMSVKTTNKSDLSPKRFLFQKLKKGIITHPVMKNLKHPLW